MAADDRRIRSNRCAAPDQRGTKLILALDFCARVENVGENARGSTKNAVFDRDSGVNADIVLELAAIADRQARANYYVLTDNAVAAEYRLGQDMRKVPDLRPWADRCAVIDIA